MKHGNISNNAVPCIGMRFEGVIQVDNKLNRAAKGFIDNLFFQDLDVYIITMVERRKVLAFCVKWAIPYSDVLQADSTLEIPDLCEAHNMIAYFDIDKKIIETVGNRGAIPTEPRLWTAIETR